MSFDLICFHHQESPWQNEKGGCRISYLMYALARIEPHCRILCVERPLYSFSSYMMADIGSRLNGEKKPGLRQITENLFYYRPIFLIPEALSLSWKVANRLNNILISNQLKNILKRLRYNESKLVLWISYPSFENYLNLFKVKLKVYDCDDDFVAHGMTHSHFIAKKVKYVQDRILTKVDLVFMVSEVLKNKYKSRTKTYVVPNGFDPSIFFCPSNNDFDHIPTDIIEIPRPLIGVTGSIEKSKIDLDLLEYLCRRHPEWSVIMVGQMDKFVSRRIQKLNLTNLYALGRKNYEKLSAYINSFDVCIIPHVNNESIFHSSPMRLFEYLPSGKPIVTVALPFVSGFEEVVRVGRTYGEFEEQITLALRESDPVLIEKRKSITLNHSWDARARKVLEIIRDSLARGNSDTSGS